MSETLQGRTALVTGAAGGIGREIVKGLLEAGATVVAADVTEPGLKALAGDFSSHAGRLSTLDLDISDHGACSTAVDGIVGRLGRLDVLVNNAAIGMGAIRADHMDNLVAIDEITPQMWDRFVAVNFSGAWYMTRAAVPHMRRQGSGRIINVTTSFFTMLRGRFHPYGPVKAGFEAMSAGHAQEFADAGITVNVVVPGGPTDTPFVPPSPSMKRSDLISPKVMAPPVVWLASEAAAGITGKRYLAARWDGAKSPSEARRASEAPIAWPDLATAPVWPGGKPKA